MLLFNITKILTGIVNVTNSRGERKEQVRNKEKRKKKNNGSWKEKGIRKKDRSEKGNKWEKERREKIERNK